MDAVYGYNLFNSVYLLRYFMARKHFNRARCISSRNGSCTNLATNTPESRQPMTTTTADEITAVEAHFERMTANSFNVYVEFDPLEMWGDMIELAFTKTWESETKETKTAFAAIVSRLRSLEGENARLKAFARQVEWWRHTERGFVDEYKAALIKFAEEAKDLLAASEESKSPGT